MTDSLNVQIALALGWRVEQTTPHDTSIFGWTCFKPDGKVVIERDFFPSEESAWAHAPDYAGSLDACAAALPNYLSFMVTCEPNDYYAEIFCNDKQRYSASADMRAEALAHALLVWATAQQKQETGDG